MNYGNIKAFLRVIRFLGGGIIVHRDKIIVHRMHYGHINVFLRVYKVFGMNIHSSSGQNHSSSDELCKYQGFPKVLQCFFGGGIIVHRAAGRKLRIHKDS